MTRRLALVIVLLASLTIEVAAIPPPPPPPDGTIEQQLDSIRDQLVALDVEKALIALNALLERPDLPDAARIAALDLRAQANGVRDDLEAVERDYRALLELQAGYVPRREVTSKKAMERFLKLQATMIGTIRLDLDPRDAQITLDGRSVSPSAEGVVPAVTGERRLHLASKGFDAQDVDVHVLAGQETPLRVRLTPNARTLVARTDIDGVSVTLDGIDVGVTARGSEPGANGNGPATLVIEDVAIGGHELRFSKTCFATESLEEIVSVDLEDRTPKVLRIVAMRPSRARITATGATYVGELRVDGERAEALPLTSFSMCPGRRTLEVVASGRVVWSETLDAEESDITIDVTPRPNAILVGAAWPPSWAAATASWSLRERFETPAGADLTTREAWAAVTIPPGTDLAVGVIPRAGVAGDNRVVLYSPALNEVEDRAVPPRASAPDWQVATLGAVLVDTGDGAVIVASTSPDGPAARAGVLPGDRVITIDGVAVASAASAREAVAASGLGVSHVLDVAPPSKALLEVSCGTVGEPRTRWGSEAESSRVVRAAWAAVDAAAGGPEAPLALANLAVLLETSGHGEAALDAWRRVRVLGHGALAARAAYALGDGLETAGKRAEAIEAFGRAHAEALASAEPALAAAAADRLADLGIAPR